MADDETESDGVAHVGGPAVLVSCAEKPAPCSLSLCRTRVITSAAQYHHFYVLKLMIHSIMLVPAQRK